MNRRARLSILAGVAVAMVAVTGAIVVSMEAAAGGGYTKQPSNPWAGLTDAQRQADVDQAHARNVRYLQDFEARHGDPRSLPVIKVSTWQGPAPSLGSAAGQASAIVHGGVQSVRFVADPNGNLPQMIATVAVRDVGKGSVAGSTISVRQPGGPVAQPGGHGALVRLEEEELVLPGDEVVLLLTRSATSDPEYRAVYGAGIQFIRGGRFAGEAAERYGVAGQAYSTMWQSVTTAGLAREAFPLRSSGDCQDR